MFQLCKHGKQDGEPCEECTKVVRLQAKVESASTNTQSTAIAQIATDIKNGLHLRDVVEWQRDANKWVRQLRTL